MGLEIDLSGRARIGGHLVKRIVLLVTVLTGGLLFGATALAQENYPPTEQPPAVSDPQPGAGESLTVSGTGYAPNSQVTVTITAGDNTGSTLAAGDVIASVTTTTDATGSFTVTISVPAGTPAGTYVLTASGVDPSGAPRVERTTIEVQAPGSGGGGGLPFTGSSSGRSVWLALALLAVGTATVVAVRQRRSVPRRELPVS